MRSHALSITKRGMKSIIHGMGIKKEVLLSYCKKKCECQNWKFNDNDILITFTNRIINKKDLPFLIRLKGLFKPEAIFSQFNNYGMTFEGNIGLKKIKGIEILIPYCIGDKVNPVNILKHELVHIDPINEHCNKEGCLMRVDYVHKTYFCDHCQNAYNHIIDSINNSKELVTQ